MCSGIQPEMTNTLTCLDLATIQKLPCSYCHLRHVIRAKTSMDQPRSLLRRHSATLHRLDSQSADISTFTTSYRTLPVVKICVPATICQMISHKLQTPLLLALTAILHSLYIIMSVPSAGKQGISLSTSFHCTVGQLSLLSLSEDFLGGPQKFPLASFAPKIGHYVAVVMDSFSRENEKGLWGPTLPWLFGTCEDKLIHKHHMQALEFISAHRPFFTAEHIGIILTCHLIKGISIMMH